MANDPATEKQMEDEIEKALRSGDPEGAARAFMTHRGGSLDAARAEISQRLRARMKK